MVEITPELEKEFERRGVLGVQAMLISGIGMYSGADAPFRAPAEAWLKRKEAEQAAQQAYVARWTKIAGIAGMIAAGIAILATVVTALAWRFPSH